MGRDPGSRGWFEQKVAEEATGGVTGFCVQWPEQPPLDSLPSLSLLPSVQRRARMRDDDGEGPGVV